VAGRQRCIVILLVIGTAAASGCTTTPARPGPFAGATHHAQASATPSKTTPSRHSADLAKHRALVAAARWVHLVEGYRLQVHPTVLGRTIDDLHPAQALRQ